MSHPGYSGALPVLGHLFRFHPSTRTLPPRPACVGDVRTRRARCCVRLGAPLSVANGDSFTCARHDRLCVILWTVALQAPLPLGFSRKEYWSGLPGPSPGDLPDPGIEPEASVSPALQGILYH